MTTQEFVFTQAPFAECHASTLVELPDGDLLAAWFGGLREGAANVAIWGARRHADTWSAPFELAREPQVPCWNPVLYWLDGAGPTRAGQVWLFYKYGRSPHTWRGAYRTSANGIDWSPAVHLPNDILGPIKDKPIRLANGDLLAGSSTETPFAWTCWVDVSHDSGRTWQRYGPIRAPGFHHGIIQPTLWEVHPGEVRMLVRSSHDIGRICEATSEDGGRTWSAPLPTALPNPNSGIDAVKLRDGTVALVYNPSVSERTPLAITFSRDEGATWSPPRTIEAGPGEYSYPAIIQTRDGLLHVTYTWRRRRIRHVVIDPRSLGF